MEYAVVAVPTAPVRKKAKHQSEMTNQLLFGDTVKVLKSKRGFWFKVRGLSDNYEGWVTGNLLQPVTEATAKLFVPFVTADIISPIRIGQEQMYVPMGASLVGFHEGRGKLDETEFELQAEALLRTEALRTPEAITALTTKWLNAPYLWGGRTMLGVDCSGFVQINYKMMGIDLPRDAWQQAQMGTGINKLKNAQCGDLAFFDDRDEIVHVGILLGEGKIIHSSGKVRIDQIDKKGIINSTNDKRTHTLRAIKRVL